MWNTIQPLVLESRFFSRSLLLRLLGDVELYRDLYLYTTVPVPYY